MRPAARHPLLHRRLMAGDQDAARELVRRYRLRSVTDAVHRLVQPFALTPSVFDALADAADHYRLEQAAARLDRNTLKPPKEAA